MFALTAVTRYETWGPNIERRILFWSLSNLEDCMAVMRGWYTGTAYLITDLIVETYTNYKLVYLRQSTDPTISNHVNNA